MKRFLNFISLENSEFFEVKTGFQTEGGSKETLSAIYVFLSTNIFIRKIADTTLYNVKMLKDDMSLREILRNPRGIHLGYCTGVFGDNHRNLF